MKPRRSEPDLDARVRVSKIPAQGRTVTVATDEEQRALLAARFGVDAVTGFAATATAQRFRGGVRVIGTVEGGVIQPCVVTGEPVGQAIAEKVDRVFLPGRPDERDGAPGAEIFVNLEDEDFPDYFEGDEIDAGELFMEVFALAIELYPRAPGAALPGGEAGDDPAALSPFAVLKRDRDD